MINTLLQHHMSDAALYAAGYQTSVWTAQWGDWIELPYVNRDGTHGRMHRRFHKEGCR